MDDLFTFLVVPLSRMPECCWAAGTSNESEFDFLRRRARWMLVTVVAYSRPQMETYRILHDMKIEMDGGDIN